MSQYPISKLPPEPPRSDKMSPLRLALSLFDSARQVLVDPLTPPTVRALNLGPLLLAAVSMPFMVWCLYEHDRQMAIVVFGIDAALIGLAVIGGMMVVKDRTPIEVKNVQDTRVNRARIWQRIIPRLPLPDGTGPTGDDLEKLRRTAHSWLMTNVRSKVWLFEEIRANIFFADYTRPEKGDCYKLRMFVAELRSGMDGHPDANVEFRPGTGATGIAFIKMGRMLKAKTSSDGQGAHAWEDLYQLSPEQKTKIHPQLRWVLSFPLNIIDTGKPVTQAILNIDGLNVELTEAELEQLAGYLFSDVEEIANKLIRVPKVRIVSFWEDLTNAGPQA